MSRCRGPGCGRETDVVYYLSDDPHRTGWYFSDEAEHPRGPFKTKEAAEIMFDQYLRYLECGPLRIAAAAIRIGSLVYALPPPARHADIAYALNNNGHKQSLRGCLRCLQGVEHTQCVKDRLQGFITNEGMFVARYQALRIAYAAGQTTRMPHGDNGLSSEDVW